MQARRIARELALLGASQLPATPEALDMQQVQNLVLAAVRTLTTESRETLEVAISELERGSERLLSSETRSADIQGARTMTREAIDLTQVAINRLGYALELPEFIQLANQQDVRDYAIEIIKQVKHHRESIDELITSSMVDWQLKRLIRLDQDILRIAVTEVLYLGVPDRVAINEAIELAKRYGDEESHKFINGVLRRVTDAIKSQSLAQAPPEV
ncbi:MAG: transcription antitermination protein NusB [Synechococcales cyanobacterium K44_A2020_017]|jgi:N utilization substance protein B|nr:transcription antitermination protein NusB [Synechococcales cyanobacterium K32_A2020_035]MBF2094511.1 transcription antitermination protein NusB [Synechococcales cyanobacterium K44_A2020_017]